MRVGLRAFRLGAFRLRGGSGGRVFARHVQSAFAQSAWALCAVFALSGLSAAPSLAQPASDELRLGPIALLASGPSYLDLGAGVYDLVGNGHRNETFAATAELHYGKKLFGIGPAVGIIQNARGGGMAYFAFYSDFTGGPIVVTPLAGFGAWWHGGHDDEYLGGTFEFRLGLTVAYQFDNRSRLGVRLGHISNANIHKRNPGDNDLMLTYALPLGF